MIEWFATDLINLGPIVAALMAMFVTWLLMPVIISISYRKRLVDKPVGARKVHVNDTPNLGGVAFYFSLLVLFLVSGYAHQTWVPYLFAGLTLIFFSGIKDDILILSAYKKLALQIIAIAFVIFGGEIVITDLGGVFGIGQIPYWAGVALTGFTMVVVINSYNLIDGIDGLAGCVGVIACLAFGTWFWTIGELSYAMLAYICAGSLLGFLWFNFHPAAIFMGDTGSHVLGYVLAFFAVSFVKTGVSATGFVPYQNAVPILVLAVLIVPLYDTLRVFILRSIKNGSPFKPDRLHIHHQMKDLGFSDKTVCYIISLLNLSIIGLITLLSELNVNLLLAVVLFSSFILFPTTGLKRFILDKMGVSFPSPREIHFFELKYGFNTRTIIKGSKRSSAKKEEAEDDYEKVAV